MNGLEYKTTNNKNAPRGQHSTTPKFKNVSERRKTHFEGLPIPTHYQGVKKPPRA